MRFHRRTDLQNGFSLIELLIVVAIILIIAAMAIPNLIRSKISANEAAAVSNIRTVNTAQTTYEITYPSVGYADSLSKLAFPASGGSIDQNHAGLLDWVIGCAAQPCPKTGYYFSIVNATGSPINNYSVTAVPVSPGNTGVRGFCSNQLSNMTYDPNSGTNCTVTLQ
jgi:type IV pilus assembly protein PilA